MNLHSFRRLAAAVLVALPAASMAQLIDFAQVDTSSNASTLVLVRELPRTGTSEPAPLLSANAVRWDHGDAESIGYVYRWKLTEGPHQWLVGAGAGANAFHSRADGDRKSESDLSARAQTEISGPAPAGNYYALAQVSSFRNSWFATAQYIPTSLPVAFEVSRYKEASYHSVSAALRISIGIPHWYIRIGATHADGDTVPFFGVTYNGF